LNASKIKSQSGMYPNAGVMI